MKRTKDEVLAILSAGAGVSLDAASLSKDDLLELVRAAADVDSMVTLRNLGGFSTDDLVEIAKLGRDAVFYDL